MLHAVAITPVTAYLIFVTKINNCPSDSDKNVVTVTWIIVKKFVWQELYWQFQQNLLWYTKLSLSFKLCLATEREPLLSLFDVCHCHIDNCQSNCLCDNHWLGNKNIDAVKLTAVKMAKKYITGNLSLIKAVLISTTVTFIIV